MSVMMSVEVRKVANGYMVIPPYNYNNGTITNNNDVFVFNTFEQLVAWLSERFEKPKC